MSFDDVCVRCGKTYGDHIGMDCPTGGTQFLQYDFEALRNVRCAHCRKMYGDHFGPHGKPLAFCNEKDEGKVSGGLHLWKVSKRRQFSEEEIPWMRDMNQTPTAVGDRVMFIISPKGAEGVVERIITDGEKGKPYFRIRCEKDNRLYDRYREHVHTMCEDF